MAVSLIRNSRVFVTYNVNSVTGLINSGSGFTATNTFEVQVLDGFSFTQSTTAETVVLSEAGPTPSRGQRSFNTQLAPVDWSFSTYARPQSETGLKNLENSTSYVGSAVMARAEEEYLWALFASKDGYIGSSAKGWFTDFDLAYAPGYKGSSAQSVVTFNNSNAHQLGKFGLIVHMEGTVYLIDNCAIESATIDFGIDQITTIAWAGKGTRIRQVTGGSSWTLTAAAGNTVTFGGGSYTGAAYAKDTTAKYIANKLSTSYVGSGINNDITLNGYIGSNVYTVALTGGNITFANNLTYLTPSNLGVMNVPITYFTGARAITGTLNAYLKTGNKLTGDLFDSILNNASTAADNKYSLAIQLGGITNTNRVDIVVGGAMMQIPTVNAEQVISTTINFTAQGYVGTATANTGTFDIEQSNEAQVRYLAGPIT